MLRGGDGSAFAQSRHHLLAQSKEIKLSRLSMYMPSHAEDPLLYPLKSLPPNVHPLGNPSMI